MGILPVAHGGSSRNTRAAARLCANILNFIAFTEDFEPRIDANDDSKVRPASDVRKLTSEFAMKGPSHSRKIRWRSAEFIPQWLCPSVESPSERHPLR
jgi:hypothetical protein